jgi:MORN repeat
MMHGKGSYYFAEPDPKTMYTGDFVNAIMEGQGKEEYRDGRVYIG